MAALATAVQNSETEIDHRTIVRGRIKPFHEFRAMPGEERARHIQEMRRSTHISHWTKSEGVQFDPTKQN